MMQILWNFYPSFIWGVVMCWMFVWVLLPSNPEISLDPNRKIELNSVVLSSESWVLVGTVDWQNHLKRWDVFEKIDCWLEQDSEGDLSTWLKRQNLIRVYMILRVLWWKYLPCCSEPSDSRDHISKHVRCAARVENRELEVRCRSLRRPRAAPSWCSWLIQEGRGRSWPHKHPHHHWLLLETTPDAHHCQLSTLQDFYRKKNILWNKIAFHHIFTGWK